jgi:hypothetical protein
MKVLWPFGVALRGETPNHLELRYLKTVVVSVEEKVRVRARQSNGLTAPNGPSQQQVISVSAAAAYLAAGPAGASTELDAKVHGFVVASLCAAAVVWAGAVFAGITINADVPAPMGHSGRAGARPPHRHRRRGKHRGTRRVAGGRRNPAPRAASGV